MIIGDSATDRSFNLENWNTEIGFLNAKEYNNRDLRTFASVTKPLSSTDSCFIMMNTPFLTEFKVDKYAAIEVGISYLTMQEGPLWNAIRGPGLAYSYSLSCSLSSGYITFMLYRVNPEQQEEALEQSKRIISHIPKSISTDTINEAKMNLIVPLVNSMKTEHDAAISKMLSKLASYPDTWHEDLFHAIEKVTLEDIRFALDQYVKPLFDSTRSNQVIVKRI